MASCRPTKSAGSAPNPADADAAPAIRAEAARGRAHLADHRRLGSVGRKSGPIRRTMACDRSGDILSNHGNSVDLSASPAGSVDRDADTFGQKSSALIEVAVLGKYITSMAQAVLATRPLDGIGRRAKAFVASGRRLALAEPRAAVAIGVASVAAATAGLFQLLTAADPANAAPPAPPPMLIRSVAPDQAQIINAALPLNNLDNPAAKPFRLAGSAAARAQALQCLASAVYYEAGNQDVNGARAVAQVVLNRVRHPAFPASVCGVVYQGSTRVTGCQFTFTCDGSLAYPARRCRLAPRQGGGRSGACRRGLCAGRLGDPLPRQLCRPGVGREPVQECRGRRPSLLSLGRWLGPAARVRPILCRPRGQRRWPAQRRARRGSRDRRPGTGPGCDRRSPTFPASRRSSSTPSMRGDKRVAVRFNQVAREASDKVVHEDYVKKVEATDNLRFALSSETTSTTEAPLGSKPGN